MKNMIRYIRSLGNKKTRHEEQKFIVEGVRAVEELLKTPGTRFMAVYTEELAQGLRGKKLLVELDKKRIEKYPVTEKELEQVSECDTPSGILAVVETREVKLADMLSAGKPFLVILDDLQDPGNAGTIIRTAEAAGVTGVILSQNSVDPYNSKVVRASMGSILRMPVLKVGNIPSLLDQLKARGIRVIACDTRGAKYYYEEDWRLPLALVLGNEGAGLAKEVLAKVSATVKIPQKHSVESLNVAAAGAIIMYQVVEKGSASAKAAAR
jgi:RNA methyltransferase, TrmH family